MILVRQPSRKSGVFLEYFARPDWYCSWLLYAAPQVRSVFTPLNAVARTLSLFRVIPGVTRSARRIRSFAGW